MAKFGKTLLRSQNKGCFRILTSNAWGRALVSVEDPEGEEITDEEIDGIRLINDFPKLPAELWSRWINLVFHYCSNKKPSMFPSFYRHGDALEVSCLLLRKQDDLTQWKIVVPRQTVSGISVDADFEESCDLVTGEVYTQFPPDGWAHAGSSHSHNTMRAFFSSVDDENELGVPGAHIVVGKVDKEESSYETAASVVLCGERKLLTVEELVDTDYLELDFHVNVLDFVTKYVPPPVEENEDDDDAETSYDLGRYGRSWLIDIDEDDLEDIDEDDIEVISEDEYELQQIIQYEMSRRGRKPAEVDEWLDELAASSTEPNDDYPW